MFLSDFYRLVLKWPNWVRFYNPSFGFLPSCVFNLPDDLKILKLQIYDCSIPSLLVLKCSYRLESASKMSTDQTFFFFLVLVWWAEGPSVYRTDIAGCFPGSRTSQCSKLPPWMIRIKISLTLPILWKVENHLTFVSFLEREFLWWI